MILEGKNAIVTGASRGIGRAIALAYAAEGANVAVVYVGGKDAADATAEECRAHGVKAIAIACDVSVYAQVESLVSQVVEEFGSVDILVNNAGITRDNLVMRMSEDDWDRVISVNLKGAFNATKLVSSLMMKARKGRIISISSVSGLMGNAGQANYAAAKAGLIGMTKSVARELAPRGVTVNAIAPGFIETDMTASLSDAIKTAATGVIPARRFGQPEDIAAAVVFLASDAAGYITGECIRVDGGMAM